MAKKSRGGRMVAAKKRAAKSPGGRGPARNRKDGQAGAERMKCSPGKRERRIGRNDVDMVGLDGRPP
jgi:hypothetical protein